MGWWQSGDDLLGDEPLDLTEEYLAAVARAYEEEAGRKPTVEELLACLTRVLGDRADEVVQGLEDSHLSALVAKRKPRPRKESLSPGDVFVLPLGDGTKAYGRLSPQHGFAEFFRLRAGRSVSRREVRSAETLRFPFLIDLTPLQTRRWRIVGNIPYRPGEFAVQRFRVGSQVTDGEHLRDGFIEVSSSMREGGSEELSGLPKLSIANEEYVVAVLKKALAS